jgi:hypothetical protein
MKLAPTIHPQAQTRLGRLTTVLLLAITAAGLPGCDEKDPTGTDLTTSSEGAQAGSVAGAVAADASGASPATAAANIGTLPLPLYQSVTSSEPAFSINQSGAGGSGIFKINQAANSSAALYGETNGSGRAVQGLATGDGFAAVFTNSSSSNSKATAYVRNFGNGPGGDFEVTKSANLNDAVSAKTWGTGNAVHGVGAGINSRAGLFENTYTTNGNSALAVRTMGPGTAGIFLAPNGGRGMFINANSKDNTLEAQNYGTGFAAKFYGTGSGKGVYIQTQGGAGLQVVGGSKNAVVHTPSGSKALYTEESTEVWFTDYGFGELEHGRARILLDPSFAQTINPEEPYHVFVQSYGDAELYVRERTPLGFEVALRAGTPNAEFSYRIVAKRLDFEGKRLEPAPWADHMDVDGQNR